MDTKIAALIRPFFQPGLQRRRLLMAIVGVCVTGVAAGMIKLAAFGVDPYQCLCNGLHNVIPISFGTLYMFINLATLILVFFLDKHYIGIATLINMFILGYIIDGTEQLLLLLAGNPGIVLRVAYMIGGIVIVCFAASLYFTADLGVSTYDAIALFLTAKKVGPFRFIRIATDCLCVLTGFVLGWKPGVGTIILAFGTGPLISLFNDICAKPMLYGREKAKTM